MPEGVPGAPGGLCPALAARDSYGYSLVRDDSLTSLDMGVHGLLVISRVRFGAGVLAVALLGSGLSTAPFAGTEATAGEPAPSLSKTAILSGTFDAASRRFDAVSVIAQEVEGDSKVGDTLAQYNIPAELSVSGDSYAVGVDPADVAAPAIGANGVVDLEVQLTSATDMWVTYASVRLVRDSSTGALAWIDPIESLPATQAAPARVARGRTVGVNRVSARIAKERVHLRPRDLVRMPAKFRKAYRTSAPGSSRLAAGGICETKYRGDGNRSTTIATSYPLGASKAWLEVSSTEGGKYGVAIGLGGKGSFKGAGTRYADGSWGFTWTKSSGMRSYRIEVNYHKYEKVGLCDGPPIRWQPHIETGGATYNTAGINRPTWNTYCANVAKGTWTRSRSDGKDYTYGAAVKFDNVLGIDLSGQKSYSKYHKLSYEIAGIPKKLCGNNDYPSMSGKVAERAR